MLRCISLPSWLHPILLATITIITLDVILPFRAIEAYLITSPVQNETWYFGEKQTLRWSSVASDPAEFSIAICNYDVNTYPTALSKPIIKGVPKTLSKLRLTASALEGLKEGAGYQINIMTLEGGSILAQSPGFTISHDEETDWDDSEDYRGDQLDSPQKKNDQANKFHQNHHGRKSNEGKYSSRPRFRRVKFKSGSRVQIIPKYAHRRSACLPSRHDHRVVNIVGA